MYSGQRVECPICKAEVIIGDEPLDMGQEDEHRTSNIERPTSNEEPDDLPTMKGEGGSVSSVGMALPGDIDRDALTITQYMEKEGISGGVELASGDDGSSASDILTDEKGRKYQLGGVVAKGGMGAIVDAKDANLRRHVAMKVMHSPEQADKAQILRFIEEAQVTSQLAHPSIVPIHELGVDASGNVFYTMKFVQGRTLKDILENIMAGDTATVREYPLSHLLTIFQKVCDAMAFAHSKRVIHRDLKPENIMVGDYGEVQVMDWGLAKVLPKESEDHAIRRGVPDELDAMLDLQNSVVESVRADEQGDALMTMDGSIMGTPGYMAPEQAEGAIEKLDARTDIYALGGILYSILTLHKPIEGETLNEMLTNVLSGKIRHPSEYSTGKKTKKKVSSPLPALPHCAGSRIPDALAAVAMEALALKQTDRYQDVSCLQKDISAYQDGFATSVEDAGVMKQLALLVRRNKGVFSTLGVCVLLGIAGTAGFILKVLDEKQKAIVALQKYETERSSRTADREESAPALYASAIRSIEQGRFEAGKALLRRATEYDPAFVESWKLLAVLALRDRNSAEGVRIVDEALSLSIGNPDLVWLRDAVARWENALPEYREGEWAALSSKVSDHLSVQGMPVFAAEFVAVSEGQLSLFRQKLERSWSGTGKRLSLKEGAFSLGLSGNQAVRDLAPLQGIPLHSLTARGCPITDLDALTDMPLVYLDLMSCDRLSDIAPLRGLELRHLDLKGTRVADLSALKDMPLAYLHVGHTQVSDLTPLEGIPLTFLSIEATRVNDLSPLRGMPLERLSMGGSRVTSLAPLRGMGLRQIVLNPGNIESDMDVIRGMQSLTRIGSAWNRHFTPAEFWKKYDAGEFD